MFDFPASPTVGQVITGGNGASYQWDGVSWGPSTTITDASANNVGRNLIHNAMFNIAQRGVGPFSGGFQYTLDRWCIAAVNDTFAIGQGQLSDASRVAIGDEAATNYIANTNFVGNAAAASWSTLQQRMENVRKLAGKTVTVSFWANAGTAGLKLGLNFSQNFGTGGSPSANVTALATGASFTLSTVMTRYSTTFTIPSVVGKTFGTAAGTDFNNLLLYYSSGSTTNQSAGNIGVQSGTINIYGVQLEIGNVATPLEKIDYRNDLANCQRFFQSGLATQQFGNLTAGTYQGSYMLFPVQMRVAPTMVVTGTPTYSNAANALMSDTSPYGSSFKCSAVTTGGGYAVWSWTASADL